MKPRDRFLTACKRGNVDRPPVWLMRQAGRYLPEYRELRKKHGFLDLAHDPKLICEVSLQPWRRFGLDAVIVFSDILIPFTSMGMDLSFVEGKGPVFSKPIRSSNDLVNLRRPCIKDDLFFVLESLERLRENVQDDAALIGFVGGPWTSAAYVIQGGGGDFSEAISAVDGNKDVANGLMDKVTEVLAEYAKEQVKAGADVVQIFETWGHLIDPDIYSERILPKTKIIIDAIKSEGGIAVLFVKESRNYLNIMKKSGADVASIGTDISISDAFSSLGGDMAIQGNLDPKVLLGPKDEVRRVTETLLQRVDGRSGWIANLGHGVLPQTPLDNVEIFVECVKEPRY